MSRRIAVVGLPFFASRVAASLHEMGYDARFLPRPGRSPAAWATLARELVRARLVYAIGSSAVRNGPLDLIARLRRPILMHWVGSDVRHALAAQSAGRASARLLRHAAHWADAPWLAEELAPLGIAPAVHPLPVPVAVGTSLPLPAEFRVLVYLPASPHAFYDVAGILATVAALPEVPFTLAGGFTPPERPPNLELAGYVKDLRPFYEASTALLRLVHHDGMSHSVVEALSFGRHVLWSYPFPGATRVAGADVAIAAIRVLQRAAHAGTLEVNETGAREVTQRYRWDNLQSEIRTGIDQLLS
ncbi:MAG: hypothetical protein ACR2HN_12080 [Tepidiformaceae bacterium]